MGFAFIRQQWRINKKKYMKREGQVKDMTQARPEPGYPMSTIYLYITVYIIGQNFILSNSKQNYFTILLHKKYF